MVQDPGQGSDRICKVISLIELSRYPLKLFTKVNLFSPGKTQAEYMASTMDTLRKSYV